MQRSSSPCGAFLLAFLLFSAWKPAVGQEISANLSVSAAGGMLTSGANATSPVNFPGVVSGTAYTILTANALSFPTFDSGTAGDSLAIGRSAFGGTPPASAAYQNVLVGALTMSGNSITTAAIKNTGVGWSALTAVTSGATNAAVGHGALVGLTTGSSNVAVGQGSAAAFTTQSNNIAIGKDALSATTGGSNVGVGKNTAENSTGGNNTVVGTAAGQFISSGAAQTALGFNAMLGITGTRITGANNTAVGQQAGLLLQGAAATNALFGSLAGSSITTGGSNVVIGPSVASTTLTTGSNNVLIGTSANLTAAAAGSADTIRVGTSSTALWSATGGGTPATAVQTWSGDIVFTNVTTGTNADFVCMAAGNKLTLQTSACTISSLRFKVPLGDYKTDSALTTVGLLEPIVFKMKPSEVPNPDSNYGREQIGLSAENVAEIEPRCAIYEEDEVTPKSYRQECLIAVLVSAVQSQQKQIAALRGIR